MKKFIRINLLVALAAIAFTASTAFAAPPRLPSGTDCGIDKDKDGAFVPDETRLVPDKDDPTKMVPHHCGPLDCDDIDFYVNPWADEVPGNDIDENCDGKAIVAEPYMVRFGCAVTDAKCLTRVEKEVDNCVVNSEHCKLSTSSGKIVPDLGFELSDIDNCDGIRSILSQKEIDQQIEKIRIWKQDPNWIPRADGFCDGEVRDCVRQGKMKIKIVPSSGKGGVKKSGGGSGVSGKAVKDLRSRLDGHGTRIENVEKVQAQDTLRLDALATTVTDHEGRIVQLEDDFLRTGEVAVKAIEKAEAVEKRQDQVEETVEDLAKTSVNVGVTVGFGGLLQEHINLDDVKARGGFAPSVLFNIYLGAETPDAFYRVRGGVGVPFEDGPEGTEAGMLWTLGLQGLWKIGGGHAFGVDLGYIDHDSGGSVLGANAKGRGGLIGPTWQFDTTSSSGRLEVPIMVSLRGGIEELGSMDDEFIAVGTGALLMLEVSAGFGFGAF